MKRSRLKDIFPNWAEVVLARKESAYLYDMITKTLDDSLSSSTICVDLLRKAMRGRMLASLGYEWEKNGGAGTLGFQEDKNLLQSSCLLLEIQFTDVIGTLRRNLLSLGSLNLLDQIEASHKLEVTREEENRKMAYTELLQKQNKAREELLETKRKTKIRAAEKVRSDPEASAKEEEEEAINSLLRVNNEFRSGMLSLLEEVGKSNKMLDEAAHAAETNLQRSERLNTELGKELSEPFCGLIVKIIFTAAMVFASCYMTIKVFPKPPSTSSSSSSLNGRQRRVWSISNTAKSIIHFLANTSSKNETIETAIPIIDIIDVSKTTLNNNSSLEVSMYEPDAYATQNEIGFVTNLLEEEETQTNKQTVFNEDELLPHEVLPHEHNEHSERYG